MATINAIAHLNELAKDVKDNYHLTAEVRETLDVAGIIKRLSNSEVATKKVDGTAFVQTFLDECAKASAEGAKAAVKNAVVHAYEQAGGTGPIIQNIVDLTKNKTDHLSVGCIVLIQGMRLLLKGENDSIGILFNKESEPSGAGIFIPVSKVLSNTPVKLQFVLPRAVVDGKWLVTVRTQATGNGTTLMKEPCSYQYSKIITVGAEENPDETEPCKGEVPEDSNRQ